MASRLRTVAGVTVWASIRMRWSRSIRSICSSTAGRRETASGAYRASARKDSISVSTELIHWISARSSSQLRSAAHSKVGDRRLDNGRRLPMTHVYQGVFAVTVPDEKVPGYPDRRRVLFRSRVRGRLRGRGGGGVE